MTRLPRAEWLRIQQLPSVRVRLLAKANRIAQAARSKAATEGVDTTIKVSQGTRPGGRPYARVESDNVEAEHGTSWTKRSRVLGRSTYQNGPDAHA